MVKCEYWLKFLRSIKKEVLTQYKKGQFSIIRSAKTNRLIPLFCLGFRGIGLEFWDWIQRFLPLIKRGGNFDQNVTSSVAILALNLRNL